MKEQKGKKGMRTVQMMAPHFWIRTLFISVCPEKKPAHHQKFLSYYSYEFFQNKRDSGGGQVVGRVLVAVWSDVLFRSKCCHIDGGWRRCLSVCLIRVM